MSGVLVIGGGIAGIAAAKAAARAGADTTLLTGGQGVHHLFSGCIDVLAYPPGSQTPTEDPLAAAAELAQTHPEHPYALVGAAAVAAALTEFTAEMAAAGLPYLGDGSKARQVVTVLGSVRHTALVPATMDAAPETIGAVCNLNGFANFSARLLAGELQTQYGREVKALDFTGPGERRDPLGLARSFDLAPFATALAEFLQREAPGLNVAVPAVLGRTRLAKQVAAIEQAFGGRLIETPGQPPSLPGLRLFAAQRQQLHEAHVRVVQGAHAAWPLFDDGKLCGVAVRIGKTMREERAAAVVLAAGHLVSGGIVGDRTRLREPLFDLPVAGRAEAPFFHERFLEACGHPALGTGVRVDTDLRPLENGAPRHSNLFACGDILAGFDPYCERSGGGVALTTGRLAGRFAAEAAQ
jgi:glycerol-3-phosphate dehydrogenase subunit B